MKQQAAVEAVRSGRKHGNAEDENESWRCEAISQDGQWQTKAWQRIYQSHSDEEDYEAETSVAQQQLCGRS